MIKMSEFMLKQLFLKSGQKFISDKSILGKTQYFRDKYPCSCIVLDKGRFFPYIKSKENCSLLGGVL